MDESLEYATLVQKLKEAGTHAGMSEELAKLQAETLARAFANSDSAAADSERMQSELMYRMTKLELLFRDEFGKALGQVKADLSARIDRLETRVNWITAVIVSALIGLYALVGGLYLR